jgi:hypothetical protein
MLGCVLRPLARIPVVLPLRREADCGLSVSSGGLNLAGRVCRCRFR